MLRKTDIPKAFDGLLYADFSDITFSLNSNGTVDFSNIKYTNELEKIKAITQTKEYTLTQNEINSIVKKTDTSSISTKPITKTVCIYEIVGFASNDDRISYITNIKAKYKLSPLSKIPTKNIVPIIIPSLLRPLFGKILIGNKIIFPDDAGDVIGHFCGFSSNNTRMVLPFGIRKAFKIIERIFLKFIIDGAKREIVFYDA